MKKVMMIVLAVFMAACFVGTAMAADYARVLDNSYIYYASPIASGDSVYVVGMPRVEAYATLAGTTMFIVNPATGVSVSPKMGYANNYLTTGPSIYATPVLYQASGDSGVTMVMQVKQTPGNDIGIVESTGTSLYAYY